MYGWNVLKCMKRENMKRYHYARLLKEDAQKKVFKLRTEAYTSTPGELTD